MQLTNRPRRFDKNLSSELLSAKISVYMQQPPVVVVIITAAKEDGEVVWRATKSAKVWMNSRVKQAQVSCTYSHSSYMYNGSMFVTTITKVT